MSDIAFIDLEASGLGAKSWPIEAGWCFQAGTPVSMLIKPDETWPTDQWDENAHALHGISLQALNKTGIEVQKVCTALNTALEGKTVYSDAPDWDGFWLYRLYQAARIRQKFTLRDFYDVFRTVAADDLDKFIDRANKIAPRAHRAVPDVLHMRALFESAAPHN